MVVIGVSAAETELALQMHPAVPGEKIYAFTADKIIKLARRWSPELLFVSVRLGGSGNRAVELLPRMRTRQKTVAVIISYSPSRSEIAEAIQFGAYAVLDANSPLFMPDLKKVILAAEYRRRRFSHERRVRRSAH